MQALENIITVVFIIAMAVALTRVAVQHDREFEDRHK
jgi:hypothetical protein